MRVLPIALFVVAACATTPTAPEFEGDYSRRHTVRMFNGEPDAAMIDTIDIGPTKDGRAVFTINMMFDNAHICSIEEATAGVTPQGLVYRVNDPTEGGPFTLAINIAGDVAKLRVLEGSGLHFCGMRGNWFGEKEFRKEAPGSND
ncbi:MAG: hypothetical protein SGJ23_02510 [Alphaproteobacteria bacterium]|nr:hypothetical protein [Alphaproteobacteria bacterium]